MNTPAGERADLARWKAVHAIRSSSATSRHLDRHAESRKGYGKGGRAGAKAALRPAIRQR